jgi:HPr kinase/phosphorylase
MSIKIGEFYEAGKESLSLQIECGQDYLENEIREKALNRPQLALAGFFQCFANNRLQVIGLAENSYLKNLTAAERSHRLEDLFQKKIPCLIMSRNRRAPPEMIEAAEKNHVPVLRTRMITSEFINAATITMEKLQAPQTHFQGTMVDIMGIGVLIEGKAGIGKSETALTLILRGHSLVSDDITLLRKDSSGLILGSSVEITRYHMEIRGLGIIHVPSLFGVASMRRDKQLDLIIRLIDCGREECDLIDFEPKTVSILGSDIPCMTLPVAMGHDMAHIIEVAALNHKLKILGHDAVKELDERLINRLSRKHF